MSIRIITDSASDILQADAKALGIEVIPLKTIFGEEEYLDGVTIDHTTFYNRLIESDVLPTTSQIAPYEYEERFRAAVEAGDEVLCITVSSRLSGCNQSANIAAAEFPGKVVVVDSLNVAIGEWALVRLAMDARDKGKSLHEISELLNEERHHIRLIALLDTLEYLRRGGRISGAVALAGSLLAIKPVVCIEDGEIKILGKARGSKKANNLLAEQINRDGVDFSMPLLLGYTGLSDDMLRQYIRDSQALWKDHVDTLDCVQLCSVIGTHAGPGAVAVAYFKSGEVK